MLVWHEVSPRRSGCSLWSQYTQWLPQFTFKDLDIQIKVWGQVRQVSWETLGVLQMRNSAELLSPFDSLNLCSWHTLAEVMCLSSMLPICLQQQSFQATAYDCLLHIYFTTSCLLLLCNLLQRLISLLRHIQTFFSPRSCARDSRQIRRQQKASLKTCFSYPASELLHLPQPHSTGTEGTRHTAWVCHCC